MTALRYPQQINGNSVSVGPGLQIELNGLVLGEKLGEGAFRTVHACPLAPDLVIKAEVTASGRFCNIDEWNLWNSLIDRPEIAAWFAPVRFISSCGSFLVQERTQPLARLPKQVPHFMSDIKLANMARLRGRPVFHDYANTKIDSLALRRLKLVDAS